MLEVSAVASTFFAFALAHAADGRRRPPFFRDLPPAWSPTVLRAIAGLSLLASVARWSRLHGTGAGLLVALATLSAVATLFVLLVPLFPRLVWGVALACAPAALVLAIAGGLRG